MQSQRDALQESQRALPVMMALARGERESGPYTRGARYHWLRIIYYSTALGA